MKRSQRWPLACAQAGVLMMAMLLFLPWFDLAAAATPFVVNSTLDQSDAVVGNGICASSPSSTTTARHRQGRRSTRSYRCR